ACQAFWGGRPTPAAVPRTAHRADLRARCQRAAPSAFPSLEPGRRRKVSAGVKPCSCSLWGADGGREAPPELATHRTLPCPRGLRKSQNPPGSGVVFPLVLTSSRRLGCTMSDVVQKLWGFCHTLRHDGIDYGDYIEQITFLLLLKLADERAIELP